jgi:hypothetical protein
MGGVYFPLGQSVSPSPDFRSILRETAVTNISSFPHISTFFLARVMPV